MNCTCLFERLFIKFNWWLLSHNNSTLFAGASNSHCDVRRSDVQSTDSDCVVLIHAVLSLQLPNWNIYLWFVSRWTVGTCCLWIMIAHWEQRRFMMTTGSSCWRSFMTPKVIQHSGFPAASYCRLTWHTPGESITVYLLF